MNRPKFEIKLAREGSLAEIKEFLIRTFFCEEAQIELVKRQDNEILLLYIKFFSFDKAAQVELVKQKNVCILRAYLQKHILCLAAQKALVEQI
ncbi:MAG: hypothetical protein IJ864_01250 [Alphaproteobacteria bacterium]|nr:hypothetical protein [Alphaproteobacteria bacterium]